MSGSYLFGAPDRQDAVFRLREGTLSSAEYTVLTFHCESGLACGCGLGLPERMPIWILMGLAGVVILILSLPSWVLLAIVGTGLMLGAWLGCKSGL